MRRNFLFRRYPPDTVPRIIRHIERAIRPDRHPDRAARNVPIIENKPLARTLFKVCKVGQEIPESLYKAVSEVIRYVFLLKGKKLSRKS